MNYRGVDWINPTLTNEEHFEKMNQNGIQLVRMWLSQWSIFGAQWNPWRSFVGNDYFPNESLSFEEVHPESDVSMKISAGWNSCVFIGWEAPQIPLKRDTDYLVRIRYKTRNMGNATDPGQSHGLVAKFGGWLWSDQDHSQRCYAPGTGNPITPFVDQTSTDWQILEGSFNSANQDFADFFYIALENIERGDAYIDRVWIQEDLGGGDFGPNLIQKPSMDHHTYFDQRNAYAFDKVLELAKRNNIYLRPVVLEKNDWIFNRIAHDGTVDTGNPNNNYFYGNWESTTKNRWLHQAWWRYLQARWGYSTNIHSWELLNEGDPYNSRHYTMANEFGQFMHQFVPNDHLVSTSNWHSFPTDQFWANPDYPHVDFADVHQYIPESDPLFDDAASATSTISLLYGANQPDGAGKPLIRGETGFVVSGSGPASNALNEDTSAVWLHNLIWGGINPGGLIESYWYETTHIYSRRGDGSYRFDHRPIFASYFQFIKDVPLTNGEYVDAEASVSDPDLRAWGQKDLVNGRAHLWIQNQAHTWVNVVDGASIPTITGSVSLTGFRPATNYDLEWWDPYESDPNQQIVSTETAQTDSAGTLTIQVNQLREDIAIKISLSSSSPLPVFEDVPFTHWANAEIEALFNAGYVVGCSITPRLYCPESILDRSESSVFVLRGEYGAIPDPPHPTPAVPTFIDVLASFWGFGWIESLWQDGFTAGCNLDPLMYCPNQEHSRAEGSVFFLRVKHGVSYEPPAPSGIFSDVDLDAWYAGWVEAAYSEGLLPECHSDPLQFCPDQPLDRAWAAYMMVQAKGGLDALTGLEEPIRATETPLPSSTITPAPTDTPTQQSFTSTPSPQATRTSSPNTTTEAGSTPTSSATRTHTPFITETPTPTGTATTSTPYPTVAHTPSITPTQN
jgi:hypothetical protein